MVSQSQLPDDYESLSAAAKLDLLFSKCKVNAGPGKHSSPSDKLKMLWRDINPTFDHVSDEKSAIYSGLKPIHATGPVVSAAFEAAKDTPYTGDFQGNPNVLMRFSLAKAPEGEKTSPGVAMKFLHDGIPSSNFVAMFALAGQDSTNVFHNTFSNHVPPPSNLKLKVIGKKFEQASKIPTHVGLSDVASHNMDGTDVNEDEINFPYEVRLVPNPELQESCYTIEQLEEIPAGTKLYDVEARADPNSEEWTSIGSFKTTSAFATSEYGDQHLFFRHQRFENDLALRPSWCESSDALESKRPFH